MLIQPFIPQSNDLAQLVLRYKTLEYPFRIRITQFLFSLWPGLERKLSCFGWSRVMGAWVCPSMLSQDKATASAKAPWQGVVEELTKTLQRVTGESVTWSNKMKNIIQETKQDLGSDSMNTVKLEPLDRLLQVHFPNSEDDGLFISFRRQAIQFCSPV